MQLIIGKEQSSSIDLHGFAAGKKTMNYEVVEG